MKDNNVFAQNYTYIVKHFLLVAGLLIGIFVFRFEQTGDKMMLAKLAQSLGAILFLYTIMLSFFLKTVTVSANNITITHFLLKKKIVFELKDVTSLKQVKIPIRGGLDYLEIKDSQKRAIIFCNYINDCQKLIVILQRQVDFNNRNDREYPMNKG